MNCVPVKFVEDCIAFLEIEARDECLKLQGIFHNVMKKKMANHIIYVVMLHVSESGKRVQSISAISGMLHGERLPKTFSDGGRSLVEDIRNRCFLEEARVSVIKQESLMLERVTWNDPALQRTLNLVKHFPRRRLFDFRRETLPEADRVLAALAFNDITSDVRH